MWTYGSITEALHHRTILLRVHTTPLTPGPASPGRGTGGTSGFTARNSAFKGLNAEQYGQAVSSLRGERGWAEGPYMRDLIVDHINGVVRKSAPTPPRGQAHGNGPHFHHPLQNGQLSRRPGTFPFHSPRSSTTIPMRPDDLTPWISTTANLDWALWYIARLLTQTQLSPTQTPTGRQVYLTIISISTNRTENQELYVAPFLYHNLNNKHQLELRGKNEIDRARYNRASRNAVLAKEVLFYGRILGESILATMAFTPEELPFELPSVYWNPPEMTDPTLPGWLARLRWHPRLLNYEMAQANRRRMMGPRANWQGQPVNLGLQGPTGLDMVDLSPEKPSLYHLRIAWERRKAVEEAERRKQSEMEEKDERERQELEVQIKKREQEEERMRVMEAELVDLSI